MVNERNRREGPIPAKVPLPTTMGPQHVELRVAELTAAGIAAFTCLS